MAGSKWDKIYAEIRKAERGHVKVGVLQEKGGTSTEGGITLIELAAIHEFGSPAAGINERSFLRSTFKVHKREEMNELIKRLAKLVVNGSIPASRALGTLGQWAAAAVKNTIRERKTIGITTGAKQELHPATIKRKGSSAPLIDTGRLMNSITYVVSNDGA